jgi:hypothetical protein
MFGLGERGNVVEEVVYDIEDELKVPENVKKYQKDIEEKIQSVKSTLREGVDKEHFENYGALLHGYLAFLRVMQRVIYANKAEK